MEIVRLFEQLQNAKGSLDGTYLVATLPEVKHHKLGISQLGKPMFFIKCEAPNTNTLMDIKLESVSVSFNRDCELYTDKIKYTPGTYSIVSLETDSLDLRDYFLESIYLIIRSLPPIAKQKSIKAELAKLVDLFSSLDKSPLRTILGLWGELLVIERSRDPEYLINSWHNSPGDKFDFNDGFDKIEVKATLKNRRIHHFALEQLLPNSNSRLMIVSILSTDTGLGKTVFDLADLIKIRVGSQSSLIRLNEIIASTLAQDFEKAFNVHFDYNLAVDTLSYYHSEVVPRINENTVPSQVQNIHFESDLTDAPTISTWSKNSKLHKALIAKGKSRQ